MMPHKILVVDDESHIVHVVSMKLTRAGYDVVTARDDEEAFEVCLAERPDMIVTDYQMPLLDGVSMCRKLRTVSECAHIPALLLTARGYELSVADLAEVGIVAVMEKPFSPREIHAKVQEIIACAEQGRCPSRAIA